MNIPEYISYFLIKFDDSELLLDWAAIMIYGRLANNLPEAILAQIGQIIFAGLLGMIFSAALLKLTSGNYLLKGWIYGLLAWFIIYALSIIFKVPHLLLHHFESVTTNIISASVYGLTLAKMLSYFDNKIIKI